MTEQIPDISQNGQAAIRPQPPLRTENGGILYSAEIKDLVSKRPPWVIRHGMAIFLFILLAVLTLSFFIYLPDVVGSRARLTSINAPKMIRSQTEGLMVKLFSENGDTVRQGAVLACMESTSDYREVMLLSRMTDSLQQALINDRDVMAEGFMAARFNRLGELQAPYQNFVQAFLRYSSFLERGYYVKKRQMLESDLQYLSRVRAKLSEQESISKEEMMIQQETYEVNRQLAAEKILSPLDLRNEKSKLLSRKATIPQIQSSIVENEAQQHNKNKEILELDNEADQQKSVFMLAVNSMKSMIDAWKMKYLLVAPADGRLVYGQFLQENQLIRNGQVVFFVHPGNSSYYAEMYIPQTNLGKVKLGQVVVLRFPSYPFQEFGRVKGKVDFVSDIATDSGFLARITLPAGLRTDYGKLIQFNEGLIADAEIITESQTLVRRFVNNIVRNLR